MGKTRKLLLGAVLGIVLLACAMPGYAEERAGLLAGAGRAEERAVPLAGEDHSVQGYVQDALEAANKGVEVIFPYAEGSVYQIYLQQGFVTDIKLAAGENLKYVGAGDTSRWVIDTSAAGGPGRKTTHIFIKPTQQGISTNLVINTDRHVYQLLLVSGSYFNPVVSWSFPKSALEIRDEEIISDYSTISSGKMDFGYKISNTKYKWAPELIFNSETKTYLKMRAEIVNSELPAFFILDDDNKKTLVTYRFVKGYMVVDRLFDKAVLLLGKKKIYIRKTGKG